MLAATWHGDSRFSLDNLPDPAPGPGQVLVAIHTAGICGSDVHATQGLFPLTPPRVMGHEYSGTVLATGRGVGRALVGRAVACEPNYGCGACVACQEGRISQCAQAVRVGGFAERVVLPGTACTGSRRGSTSPPRRSPSRPPAAWRDSRWPGCDAEPRWW